MSLPGGLDYDETIAALWLANYAETFLDEFAKGKVTGETLIGFAHAIRELETKIMGGVKFYERAEELEELQKATFTVEGQQ